MPAPIAVGTPNGPTTSATSNPRYRTPTPPPVNPNIPQAFQPAGNLGPQLDATNPQHVQGLRTFLINQGYDLPPQGSTIGPLMRAALQDWHSGADSRNPKAWNAKYSDPTAGSTQPAPRMDNKRPASTTPPKMTPPPRTRNTNGNNSAMNKMMASLLGGSSNNAVQKLAQSMTNAQYTAPMDLLQSQIDQESNAETQRQQDIGSWFQSVLGQNKTGTANDLSGSGQIIDQGNSLEANILKSLGGAAGTEVGKAATTNQGLLQALEQNNQDYGHNMNTALALSGRDALNSDAYQSKQTTKGLLDQLMALTQQKGQSLAANLSAAQDQILKDKAQKINNFATLSMLSPQMNAAKLSNAMTRARIGDYQSQAMKNAAESQKAQGSNAIDMSKLQTSVYSQLPMSGTPGVLTQGTNYSQVGQVISATLKGAGIQRGTPLYQSAARSIASGLRDAHGRPVWAQLQQYFS